MRTDHEWSALDWLPVAAVLLAYLARLLELRQKRATLAGTILEKATLQWFKLAGAIMVIGGLMEYFYKGRPFHGVLFSLGIFSAAASFIIRRRAISALGQFWSLHVEIRENHRFIQTGPFRWVRHPTYFSMILELLACALMLSAPWALLACAPIFCPVLRHRLKQEEEALVEKFGEAYRSYQATTPAIIPYKWPSTQ